MVVGIALGVGIADALVSVIGSGTWQIAAIVVGAMVVAVALSGSVVLVSETAASALLVVTVQPPGTGLSGARFLDSLLGGLIGLVVTSLLPASPGRTVHNAAAKMLAQIAATLEEVAQALERRDPELAERAWTRASEIDLDELRDAVAAGRETLRLAPWLRGTRAQFARYSRAVDQIDNAVASVEALSRAAVRAIAQGDNVPPPVPEAVRELAEAVLAPGGDARRGRRRRRGPRARAARRGPRDARARADGEPVGERHRRPGARDGGRPAARLGAGIAPRPSTRCSRRRRCWAEPRTIASGGASRRTGRPVVPSPVVTYRWRPSSTTWPAA